MLYQRTIIAPAFPRRESLSFPKGIAQMHVHDSCVNTHYTGYEWSGIIALCVACIKRASNPRVINDLKESGGKLVVAS